MDARIKERWLDALRSGDYAQGKGRLHYVQDGKHKFCCLGVLCEVAIEDGVDLERTESNGRFGYDDNTTTLPSRVVHWAGFSYIDPVAGEHRLSILNDGTTGYGAAVVAAHNFAEIADLIEENL